MSSYFIHVQEKKKVCIFLIKIYRKIQTELCMPLLSHFCLSTCLYFLISFTMWQYHVVAYSNALSLSFKSLYHWQNQFQPSCAFLSSCLSICISMESLSLKCLGFLWISIHLSSKLVKGFMGVWLVRGTGTLGLEVFTAMVVKRSAAWSRDVQILLLRLQCCSSSSCKFVWTSVKSLSNLQVLAQYFLIQVLSLSKADGQKHFAVSFPPCNFAACSFYHYATGNDEKQCLHQTKISFILLISGMCCIYFHS